MTDNKDNGLRKAARQNYTPRLSSNFTYRTMKRIAEEMYLREKRQEKRINDHHSCLHVHRMHRHGRMGIRKRNSRSIVYNDP